MSMKSEPDYGRSVVRKLARSLGNAARLMTGIVPGRPRGAGYASPELRARTATQRRLALEIVQTFLGAKFSGLPRHRRRVEKIEEIERKYCKDPASPQAPSK